jgi:hypothetical protein
LLDEIESGAMLDIDGTLVSEVSHGFDELEGNSGKVIDNRVTSANLYGEKMNLENYREFHYSKALNS